MGLDPIGYKPWTGKRTEHNRRFLIIAQNIVLDKLRSKSFLFMYILGMFLVHVFPLIFYSMMSHDVLEADLMSGYMQDGVFLIFNIILVSLICADLVSEDMRSNSIVLYLSRALQPDRYLLGKWLGAVVTLSLFTLVPPLAVSIAVTATQGGGDYLASLGVIGRTALAGSFAALFLVPVGMMMSALTSKRTYAGVGTFMLFFILVIVSMVLSGFSADWEMLSPINVLSDSYDVLYGITLSSDVNTVLMALVIVVLTVPPMWFVYQRIVRKGVGK